MSYQKDRERFVGTRAADLRAGEGALMASRKPINWDDATRRAFISKVSGRGAEVSGDTRAAGAGGGLDLERRLADGEAAIRLAVIRWVHACADVTAERLHWRICQLRGAGWRDLEVTTAEHWRRAAVRCAHEAHELERLLDARDMRRAHQEQERLIEDGYL